MMCLFAVGAAIGWVVFNFGISLSAPIFRGLKVDMWPHDTESHELILALVGALVCGTVAVLPAFIFRIVGNGGDNRRHSR